MAMLNNQRVWVSIVMVAPPNGWLMEKTIDMDENWGCAYFRKPPFIIICIYIYNYLIIYTYMTHKHTHIPFISHSTPIEEIPTEEVPAGHLVIFFQEILHEAPVELFEI